MATEAKHIKELRGVVVSAKNDKTITVEDKTVRMHEKYKKSFYVTKKFHIHDENNACNEWDTILFRECKPHSKTKRRDLVSIEK